MKWIVISVVLLSLVNIVFATEQADAKKVPEPRFEARPAFDVVGMYIEDTMDSQEIMKLWTDYYKNKHSISGKIGVGEYGITTMSEDYNPETQVGYRYMVATTVKSTKKIPEGMIAHTVPAANYAIFEHHGLVSGIEKTYNYIFGEWLPQSGYEVEQKDVFEYYGKKYKHNSDDSIAEIWVPVTKKAEQPQK